VGVLIGLLILAQPLQCMLFNRTLGEEVVEKAEQSDVCFRHASLSLCSHVCINSGYAALSRDGKHLLVSNLKDGVDEYQFPSMEKVQTFTHPIETNCILQTRSLPSCDLIITGGDDGFARVFNRITGQLVSEIHHGGRRVPFNYLIMGLRLTCCSSWPAHTGC
jgi:hypothetical protein